jgi:cytochrome c oxidase subunit IV
MSGLEGANLRFYMLTYAILVFTTLAEVVLFVAAFRLKVFDVDLGTPEGLVITALILLPIALYKVFLIAMNYMHMKWEPKSVIYLSVTPLLFILVMVAVFVLMGDYRACNSC